MMRELFQADRIQNAMNCNRFLFWLQKVPGAGALFPDGLYADSELKRMVGRISGGLLWVRHFGGKLIYLYLCCLLPAGIRSGGEPSLLGWPFFVQAFFFLSFVTGAFLQSGLLAPSLLSYTCVRQMGMPAGASVAAVTGKSHLVTLITFTPALMLCAWGLGQSPWAGLVLSVELACVRLVAEGLFLRLYTRGVIVGGTAYLCMMVLGCMAGAYYPLLSGAALPLDLILLHPAAVCCLFLLGGLSARYLIRYPDYRAMVLDRCRPDRVNMADIRASARATAFQDVKLRDADGTAKPGAAQSHRHGYEYLNDIFFARHRRILLKLFRMELAAVGVLFLAGLAGVLLAPGEAGKLLAGLPGAMGYFVFLFYFACGKPGERICKAMFYNCDIALLRYPWYRERGAVLKCFRLRLWRILKLNLLLGGALCLALGGLALAAGIPAGDAIPWLAFLAGLMGLSFLFSVHPIFLYYAFQPYTTALAVKNPFFSVFNWGMYFLCFACMYIRQSPAEFAVLVFAASLTYCGAALLVVRRRAVRTFRVK